jgi:Protein of unknown function (DUF3485)
MHNRKRLVLTLSLVLMAGTAGALNWLKTHKRLGQPGIKSTPVPESVVMNIALPEYVLDFSSTNLAPEKIVLDYLPKDTSFARRRYVSRDGPPIEANIILMGTDRTSIHKAEYCLTGAGLKMDQKATTNITISGPQPYQLSVAKWLVSGTYQTASGEKARSSGVYVFWFVADGKSTPSYFKYKLWLMWDLLHTAVLERWAYVSYFIPCEPGQEEATFERVKRLIAASVPEFQLPPRTTRDSTVAQQ